MALSKLPSAAFETTGRKNLVINGAMQVAQRGDETTGVTSSGYYCVDRFRFGRSTGTYTISQEDDGPEGFAHSYKILTTSAGSELAGNYQIFEHRLEGRNLQHMLKGSSAAKEVTLTFYVKSNVTGNYQVNLRDIDNDRQVGAAFSVDTSATWEKKVVTFPADTTGSFDNDSNVSMNIEWFLGAGSNFQGGSIPTSWEASTNTDRAANVDVDLAETVNNYIQFTGVQLEVGDSASPFEHRSFSEELALCQRYFFAEPNTDTYHNICQGFYSASTLFIGNKHLPVPLRTDPVISTSGTYQCSGTTGLDASNIIIVDSAGSDVTTVQVRATVSGATAGQGSVLRNKNDANATFFLSAEL